MRKMVFALRECLALVLITVAALNGYALAEPDSASEWYDQGNGFLAEGLFEDALESYDQALQLDPSDVNVWMKKAEAFDLLKMDNESKDALRRALEITDETSRSHPNDEANWQRKGIILANLDHKDEAIEALERAIAEANRSLDDNPSDVEALWLMAECLEILGRKEAAIQSYDQVIESNTSLSAGAWIRKANLLAPKQYNESLLAYSKAFELMLGKNDGIPVSTIWEEDGFSVFTNAWFNDNQILLVSQGLYNQSNQSFDRYMLINTQFTSNWSIGVDKIRAADILNNRNGVER